MKNKLLVLISLISLLLIGCVAVPISTAPRPPRVIVVHEHPSYYVPTYVYWYSGFWSNHHSHYRYRR